MMNDIKHAIVEADFIGGLELKVITNYSSYLAYSERGDEIAAACCITDARAASYALAFIQMPCGRTALEVSMNDSRFMKVIDRLLKDDSFRAIVNYRRVTK